jgi:Arc/MetJ-type ribon-helix-helix transcriptional regulator
MSIQIAVRLPEDIVEFVDGLVSHGDAPSPAAVVSDALNRERRRQRTACDAAILAEAAAAADSDLDALAAYAARRAMTDLG